MTTGNENHSGPQRTAGVEEGLGLTSNSMNMLPFNPMMELARGSIKPEEYMIRSSYTAYQIHLRALEYESLSQCEGYTDTEGSNWTEDHMTPAIDGKRVELIKEMFIAATIRNAPQVRPNSYESVTGGGPMQTQTTR